MSSDQNIELKSWAIQTCKLSRLFQGVSAVKPLDLQIERGKIFGLLGSNGAGKSTTIKMLTTLLPPSSGTALVAGYDICIDPAQVRRHIGYVPQLLSADSSLTGYENLRLYAKLYSIPAKERETRIQEAIHLLQIDEYAHRLVKTYSGGMIRRLEIAQTMLHRPQILFLDEPTIGLDPVARRMAWKNLQDIRSLMHVTILITTHDMEEADFLCDEIAILNRGAIAAIGTPQALKESVAPHADLDDVFAYYCGGKISEEGGTYGDARKTRTTAKRLN